MPLPWPRFLGEVALWGRVIEHEHGYRAERARPTRLILIIGDRQFAEYPCYLERVASEYGIPITIFPASTLALLPGGLPEALARLHGESSA